jgi:hypothetical protein
MATRRNTPEAIAKRAAANRGKKRSKEFSQRLSERSKGWRFGFHEVAEGSYITKQGYRSLTQMQGHPVAARNGDVLEHRYVLYEKIGPGRHPCHWGCGRIVEWGVDLHVDHVDADKLNNAPENVVPSCNPCNVSRASKRLWADPEYRARQLAERASRRKLVV